MHFSRGKFRITKIFMVEVIVSINTPELNLYIKNVCDGRSDCDDEWDESPHLCIGIIFLSNYNCSDAFIFILKRSI